MLKKLIILYQIQTLIAYKNQLNLYRGRSCVTGPRGIVLSCHPIATPLQSTRLRSNTPKRWLSLLCCRYNMLASRRPFYRRYSFKTACISIAYCNNNTIRVNTVITRDTQQHVNNSRRNVFRKIPRLFSILHNVLVFGFLRNAR